MTNPYAPPQANVETPASERDPSELELASLLMRFLGNLLDTVPAAHIALSLTVIPDRNYSAV